MRCRFWLRADSVTAGKTSGLQSSENRGNQVKLPSAKLHFLAPTHSADCIRPTLTSCESVVVRANEEESWAGDGSILGSCIIFISIQIFYINSRWVFLSCLVWDCLMTCSTLLLSKLIVLHHHRTKLRLIGFIIYLYRTHTTVQHDLRLSMTSIHCELPSKNWFWHCWPCERNSSQVSLPFLMIWLKVQQSSQLNFLGWCPPRNGWEWKDSESTAFPYFYCSPVNQQVAPQKW